MRKTVIANTKSKPWSGTSDKQSYLVNVPGIPDGNGFPGLPFGRKLGSVSWIQNWQKDSKIGWVDCKGKPILPCVRAWIKRNKPEEYYCEWKTTSYNWKDDSVQIYYR
jgi:hypothetical protein